MNTQEIKTTYEIPINTQSETISSKMNNEMLTLQTDYELLAKEKNDIEHYYQTQLEKATEQIRDLKEDNESLRNKLQEQLSIYNKLLVDFSAQQNLLQAKSEKINNQIEQINSLAEQLNKLKVENIDMEEALSKIRRKNEDSFDMHKHCCHSNNDSSLIQSYQKDIERLKMDNKLLIQENDKLCKDNIKLQNEIKHNKTTYEYRKNNSYSEESVYY